MKVILISRVAKLGSIGDVVSVKDGYGKNFLIPQKKAIFCNAANEKIFKAKKQQFESQSQDDFSAAEAHKAKLNGKDIIILGNASDDGRLYGSVTTANVAAKINDVLGKKIVSRIDILLKKPIKDIGVHDVKVDLYSGVAASVRVVVSRSESEVENLIAKYSVEGKDENRIKDSKVVAKEVNKSDIQEEVTAA